MAKQKYWDGTAWQEVKVSASKTTIVDAGNLLVATDVEGALQEIKSAINVDKAETATELGLRITRGGIKRNDLDGSQDANKWNLNDFDESSRQAILEANEIDINYVLGLGNVTSENIAINGVSRSNIDFIKTNANLFNGFVNLSTGGEAVSSVVTAGNASVRSFIFNVKSGKKYIITKTDSDRLRVGLASVYPVAGVAINNYIRHVSDIGPNVYEFISPLTGYALIIVSIISTEPRVYVEELDLYTASSVTGPITFAEAIKAKNIENNKNIFNGVWVTGSIGGYFLTDSSNFLSSNGRVAIMKCDKNTVYSISKTASNRFKVAVANKYPLVGDPLSLLYSMPTEQSVNDVTVTTLSDTEYLLVYSAFESDPPYFMQVEKSPRKTDWVNYGYKFTQSDVYGLVGDGIADDTLALQRFFDGSKGLKATLPGGKYLVSSTTYLSSDTVLNAYNAEIILAESYNLDAHNWRDNEYCYPIVTNTPNAKNIHVRGLTVRGSTFTDHRQFGFALIDAIDCTTRDVKTLNINYIRDATIMANKVTNALAWNYALLRCKNVETYNLYSDVAGYECVGLEHAENCNFYGVYAGIAWRVSFQAHRGTKNCHVYGLTIKNDDGFGQLGGITFHGTLENPVDNITIDNAKILKNTIYPDYGMIGIQSVEGHEHNIRIINSDISTTERGIKTSIGSQESLVKGWIIKNNRITVTNAIGVDINSGTNTILKDNIIDSIGVAIRCVGVNNIVNDNILLNNQTVITT